MKVWHVLALYPRNVSCDGSNFPFDECSNNYDKIIIEQNSEPLKSKNIKSTNKTKQISAEELDGEKDSNGEDWKLLKDEICDIEKLINQGSKGGYTRRKESVEL